ncbi:ArsR/SmtB family transcription factor [Rathayibacter agropyri]|uniref:ArsR/SmtB family transcription factor n=1 Tax=Rathayibacter agropyri TaxID=1634927 RepID=UPI0015651EA1|nr:helix-turn-helix domain-containing protein [Rathayibacter agropyri]NRD08776.1 helix-turn-helix transcriptional regulator [Rathayibacter agropyri]
MSAGPSLHHPLPAELEVGRVLAALADDIRREVLRRIGSDGPLFCGDLDLGVGKSTMSHHFTVLREAGLLHTEVVGNHRRITRRDAVIDGRFPGLLASVGLPPASGSWDD